jgi:hypothetical protein
MKTINLRPVLTFLIAIMLVGSQMLFAQSSESEQNELLLKNSIEISPMSPMMNIYALQYGYSFDHHNDLILGLAYMAIPFDKVGRTHASSLIIGYRRNFGYGIHAEYSVYPMYDNFYEENKKEYFNGVDIWNEFRLGYQYDFNISDVPVYVKAQLPFGFAIYSENKPKSFKDKVNEGDNKFFYKAVIVYVGIRF